MPSLKMKTKLSKDSLSEKNGLHVCRKSTLISKSLQSQLRVSSMITEKDTCARDCCNDSSSTELSSRDFESSEAVAIFGEENSQPQMQTFACVDSTTMGRLVKESIHNCTSDLGTIFSPALEPVEVHDEANIESDPGCTNPSDLLQVGSDETDDNRSPYGEQTCNVSDFFISDMIIANIPFDENRYDGDNAETNTFPDYLCAEPSMIFDVAEQYIILPLLEGQTAKKDDVKSEENSAVDRANSSLYLIEQARLCDKESDFMPVPRGAEDFHPQFIKNMPELSDAVSSFLPTVFPKDNRKRKTVTLVLDLDETLIHSTLEHCDDADFTFPVFFNMKEHTVYVRQRPHLHTFLKRVTEMFEVVIFTASQSLYAAKLLDMLDPDGKIISRRMYRESCIFSDGSCIKDLTILGIDLSKVAIIDNSPQVFRLQVNNGIPIKSWFDDPFDNALISLLPFLETLADADDVRPIIAKRFGNRE